MQSKSTKRNLYLESSMIGAISKNLILPFEHPMELIKTLKQSKPFNSYKDLILFTYKNNGTKWLYTGYSQNFLKASIKEIYRWPMMIFFNDLYGKNLNKQKGHDKICTGLTIAILESFIICPLERIKILMMTQNYRLSRIIKENKLFFGIKIIFVKQIVSWTSFLYFDHICRQFMRKINNIEDNQKLQLRQLIFSSIFVGISNMVFVMPFDFIKTQIQMQSTNQLIINTIKIFYQENGLSIFYSGWRFRVLQYYINSLIYSMIIEQIENKIRNNL